MKVLGIVVEYNPFHNGHKYHIEKSREVTGCDAVIAVMSGNFVQRGEPAVVNKWARTKMALLSGVDLVIEIPNVYAVASAEYFAFGAIKLLDSTGVVDCLCFGSEGGELGDLISAADILIDENMLYRERLKSSLKSGLSFPAARAAALSECFKASSKPNIERLMRSSNSILGIEYIKALKKLNSHIAPHTIGRLSNNYKDKNLTGNISSATAIRSHIKKIYEQMNISHVNELDKFKDSLPQSSLSILEDEFGTGRGPVFPELFGGILLANLRRNSLHDIEQLQDVSEGLENRIKYCAEKAGDYDSLIEMLCAKRYPQTRIKRTLFYSMIGLNKETFRSFDGPEYIRVLGFNSKGRELLSKIRKHSSLPLITKTSIIDKSLSYHIKDMFRLENLATDLYVLAYNDKYQRKAGQEYRNNLIII